MINWSIFAQLTALGTVLVLGPLVIFVLRLRTKLGKILHKLFYSFVFKVLK